MEENELDIYDMQFHEALALIMEPHSTVKIRGVNWPKGDCVWVKDLNNFDTEPPYFSDYLVRLHSEMSIITPWTPSQLDIFSGWEVLA